MNNAISKKIPAIISALARTILARTILAGTVLAGAASAQSIESVTAEQLAAALSDAGLGPSMIEDAASGAPVATATAGDFNFVVRAMDCTGRPMACENLVFFANFDLGRAATQTDFRIVNGFNDRQVFGRAFVLEKTNQVGVDYVIDLGGGVSQDHLAQNIARWADVIAAFADSFRESYSES